MYQEALKSFYGDNYKNTNTSAVGITVTDNNI